MAGSCSDNDDENDNDDGKELNVMALLQFCWCNFNNKKL